MDADVRALIAMPSAEIVAGGAFSLAGGNLCAFVARLTTTCPATATTFANGCPSSGGNNLLTVTGLPWADGTFRTHGSGLPTLAFVLGVTSLAPLVPPLPFSSVLAEGVPGCFLRVEPDILDATFTTTGTVDTALFLPNSPPLVSVQFHYQLVVLEVDMSLAFVAVTSTNALQLTVGSF
jgi:hypothetical protein